MSFPSAVFHTRQNQKDKITFIRSLLMKFEMNQQSISHASPYFKANVYTREIVKSGKVLRKKSHWQKKVWWAQVYLCSSLVISRNRRTVGKGLFHVLLMPTAMVIKSIRSDCTSYYEISTGHDMLCLCVCVWGGNAVVSVLEEVCHHSLVLWCNQNISNVRSCSLLQFFLLLSSEVRWFCNKYTLKWSD